MGEFYSNLRNIEQQFLVKISFNKSHLTDDCYPIDFLTTVLIQGKNHGIFLAHQVIKEQMLQMVVRREFLSR